MKKEDAEEFTQALGQIVGGSWRQIALAKRLGVPKALDLSVDEWVNKRLGGYVRMSVEDRRKAAAELSAEGASTREIAEVIGINQATVVRDLGADANASKTTAEEAESDANASPIDAVAALAANVQVKAMAKATATRAAVAAENVAELVRVVDHTPGLHFGDFRELASDIPDESVELIFTDPPYDNDSIPMFADAAKMAARILKHGGSMLCYCGQLQLPKVIPLMSEHLRYWWLCQHFHDGGPLARMREFGVIVHGKPMVWFVKGTRGNKHQFVDDSVAVKKEKAFHPWQQAEAIATYYIENLVPETGTVVDFFAGGGTTLVAAKKLGRQFIGFEIDAKHHASASGRLFGTQDAA